MAKTLPSDNVYLKGLPEGTSEHVVSALLAQYGDVMSTKLIPPKGGQPDMVAMVRMGSVDQASHAIATLNGITLTARFATNSRPAATPQAPAPSMPVETSRRGSWQEPRSNMISGGAKQAEPADEPNLYVKGLPLETTYEGLLEMFQPYGHVASARILHPKAGHNDVTAMVRMGSIPEAEAAIDNLHGMPVAAAGDIPLTVKFHGDGKTPSDNIFIKGLSLDIDEATLNRYCSSWGRVASTKLLPKPGMTDLAALVRFSSVAEASQAVTGMNGQILSREDQTTLTVRFATEGKRGVSLPSHSPPQPTPSSFARSAPSTTSAPVSLYNSRARPTQAQSPRPSVSLGLTAKFQGDGSPSDNVFIKGLPLHMSQEDLAHLCGQFGNVMSVKLLPKADKNDLAALVRFDSVHTATGAIHALHGNALPEIVLPHHRIREKTNQWRSSRPY